MSIIEAASVNVRTLVDGTLRITVDVEPRHAKDAFALFGAPGVPMALAALKTGQDAPKPEPEAQIATAEPERPRGGMWSQWAALRCQDTAFQVWLSEAYAQEWAAAWQGNRPSKANAAADVIRRLCGIESRAELDNDEEAKGRFDKLIRGPWQKHYQSVHA